MSSSEQWDLALNGIGNVLTTDRSWFWLGFRFAKRSPVEQKVPGISHKKTLSTVPRAEPEGTSV